MATTPLASSTAAKPVAITDPFVSAMQEQHTATFTGAQNVVTKFVPAWEKDADRLIDFQLEVRNRASNLQHEKAKVPSKEELVVEREKFLNEYWNLKAVSERVILAGKFLHGSMTALTPQLRIYVDEQKLGSDNPELLAQIKQEEQFCRDKVGELGETFTKVGSLRDKMVEHFTKKLNYEMQRFCQIVDNDGKPISTTTRVVDWATTPVVPKPLPPKAPVSPSQGSPPSEKSGDAQLTSSSQTRERSSSQSPIATTLLGTSATSSVSTATGASTTSDASTTTDTSTTLEASASVYASTTDTSTSTVSKEDEEKTGSGEHADAAKKESLTVANNASNTSVGNAGVNTSDKAVVGSAAPDQSSVASTTNTTASDAKEVVKRKDSGAQDAGSKGSVATAVDGTGKTVKVDKN